MKAFYIATIIAIISICASCSNSRPAPSDPADLSSDKVSENSNPRNDQGDSVSADNEFVFQALNDGLLEIKLGEMAMARGKSNDVKSFGEMMVRDHSVARDELATMARARSLPVAEALTEGNQKKFDLLKKLYGFSFDSAYTTLMVSAHQKAIEKFKMENSTGKDTQVRGWAALKIPTLVNHYQMADQTRNGVMLSSKK